MIQLDQVTPLLFIALAIGFIPFLAMVVTSYAKIVVVLGLLRNALGVQQVPPNTVLNGIAILSTLYIMAPIGMQAMNAVQAQSHATQPTQAMLDAVSAAREPFRAFLLAHSSPRERMFLVRSASAIWPKEQAATLKPDDLIVLAPAFTLGELTDAFKIGFMLFITFTIIDLIIANVLLAIGLNQVSPTNVAIPFKLLLFVSLDGWSTLLHGLIVSYRH